MASTLAPRPRTAEPRTPRPRTPRPLTALRRAAARVDAKTPAHRDRALDGLRALALLAVPVGHWMLGGLTRSPDGALHNTSPLSTLGFFAPLSWVLQMLGVFFLVGGHSSVRSLERARARGVTYGGWLRARTVRLLRPVLGVTAVWAALIPLLPALGVPADTLRTGATLVVQPLWYIGVYLGLTALTPLCVAAGRRLGGWSAGLLVASVAAVDLLRYGPWAGAVPSWVALLNILPGWLFGYQLGVLWAQGGSAARRPGCCCSAAARCSPRCCWSSTTRPAWSACPGPSAPTRTRRPCWCSPWRRSSAAPRCCCGSGWAGC